MEAAYCQQDISTTRIRGKFAHPVPSRATILHLKLPYELSCTAIPSNMLTGDLLDRLDGSRWLPATVCRYLTGKANEGNLIRRRLIRLPPIGDMTAALERTIVVR